MALVELMMLFAAIKAKDFQHKPTVRNMTDWCNAAELIGDPHTVQVAKYRQVRHTTRRKVNAEMIRCPKCLKVFLSLAGVKRHTEKCGK